MTKQQQLRAFLRINLFTSLCNLLGELTHRAVTICKKGWESHRKGKYKMAHMRSITAHTSNNIVIFSAEPTLVDIYTLLHQLEVYLAEHKANVEQDTVFIQGRL